MPLNITTLRVSSVLQKAPFKECLSIVAGETRFEHATYGFGDRYSTVEPLPYQYDYIIQILKELVNKKLPIIQKFFYILIINIEL